MTRLTPPGLPIFEFGIFTKFPRDLISKGYFQKHVFLKLIHVISGALLGLQTQAQLGWRPCPTCTGKCCQGRIPDSCSHALDACVIEIGQRGPRPFMISQIPWIPLFFEVAGISKDAITALGLAPSLTSRPSLSHSSPTPVYLHSQTRLSCMHQYNLINAIRMAQTLAKLVSRYEDISLL